MMIPIPKESVIAAMDEPEFENDMRGNCFTTNLRRIRRSMENVFVVRVNQMDPMENLM